MLNRTTVGDPAAQRNHLGTRKVRLSNRIEPVQVVSRSPDSESGASTVYLASERKQTEPRTNDVAS